MRILIDECVDRRLAKHIVGHDAVTAQRAGLAGIKNGDLLRRASKEFDVFLTVDANLPAQQNLRHHDVAVVVLRAKANRLADLLPLVPSLLSMLPGAKAGEALIIRASAP